MKIQRPFGNILRQIRRGTQRPVLLSIVFLTCVLSITIPHAAGQAIETIDPKHHPAPGTKITRFQKIDEGVYKGSEPRTDADYSFLQSIGIKYIIELKFMPVIYRHEVNKARKYGILVIPITINASTFAPSEKHVRRVLCLLSDKRLRPVYFHCTIGRDRTALIATLYEVYFLGLPPEKAREEMKHFGFKESWTLSGLSDYLQKHASSPWENSKDKCKRYPLPSSDKEVK